MSKQSEAKAKQGYSTKKENCGNCQYFAFDTVRETFWTVEKNLRCGIGGFAVKKSATCNMWKAKEG